MSFEKKQISVDLIKDVDSITLIETIRIACVQEQALQTVEDVGINVSEVLFNQMVLVRNGCIAAFKKAGVDHNVNVIRLKYEESLLAAEQSIKDDSSPFKHMKKLPRCWINAKSSLCTFIEYDGNPEKCPTVSKVKKFNSETKKRLAEEDAQATLKAMADNGVDLSVTGESDDKSKSPANVEKSEVTQTNVKVEPLAVSAAELDDEVLALIIEITTNAQAIHPDKAIKMLTGLSNQFKQLAGAVVKSVVNG